ncbi:MAG: T9SS type A sorting domain-containing protein [Flavobacterium sp.]|nr:MAG: T9SS type A sorting domain-containing protein [Flavobacterium sp.]
MRKITMLITLLLAFTTVSYAQFPQGFEGTTFPPAGWTSFIGTNGVGTAQNWQRTTTVANTGTASAYVRYENVTGGPAEDWLVTPQVAITAANSNLSFFQTEAFPDTDYGTTYTVRVSTTSQTSIPSFTTILTQTEDDVADAFGAVNVDLSAYVGQSVYVAFVMSQDDGDNWYIDDVNFGTLVSPPDCASNPTPADAAVNVQTGDVVFSWTAPTTGGAATGYDMYYGLTADDVTNLVGSFATNSATITLTGYDTTFYWKIVPKNSGGSATGCDVWSFTTESAPAVPDNDACSTATAITSFPYTNTQDAFSATNNDGFITDCTDAMNDGVWYTVTGNGFDLTVNVTAVDGWDPQIGVYSGTCGAFTCVDTADNGGMDGDETVVIPASVVGTTYYINIGQYADGTDNPEGPFTINVITGTSDTPDYANLQYPVSASVVQGNSANVYGQVYEGGLTDVEPGLSGQAAGIEMWVGVNADNTNPNSWDETTWTPGVFNSAATTSNNDEYMLAIGADQAPGTYYYATRWRLNNGPFVYGGISAGGDGNFWDGTTYNSGVLTVTPAPAPANDECSGAVALTPGGVYADYVTNGSNFSATQSAQTAPTTCLGFAGGDVWFSVVVPASGNITIETGDSTAGASGVDTVITAYSGTCGAPVQVGCDDDGADTGAYSKLSLTGQTPGSTLLLRVYEYNNDNSGSFGISAYDASLANNQFTNGSFTAYPNPVKSVLNLSSVQNISNVAVYNLLGQQVLAKPMNASEGQIDMSSLSRGTYMVKVTANNEVKTIKVIKE